MNRLKIHAKAEVDFVFTDEIKAEISFAQRELSEALLCIVENAVCYSKDNSKPCVRIHMYESEEGYCFSIKDNGKGVEKVNEINIFEPFFTTRKSTCHQGLGLSLASILIKSFGGSIKYKRLDSSESCFYVNLPKKLAL